MKTPILDSTSTDKRQIVFNWIIEKIGDIPIEISERDSIFEVVKKELGRLSATSDIKINDTIYYLGQSYNYPDINSLCAKFNSTVS